MPPVPWANVLHCTKFNNRCTQKDQLFLVNRVQYGPSSEDCLYLNVFSPAWLVLDDKKLFPVMVFVHGGAFIIDCSSKYGDIGISTHLVIFNF